MKTPLRRPLSPILFALAFAATPEPGRAADDAPPADRPTLQELLDARPGTVVEVPPGVHEIRETLRIATPGGGLSGTATIVQTDPAKAIVRIDHADGAVLRGLTLTRPEGRRETDQEAVLVTDSRDVTLADLRVIDNQTRGVAVAMRNSDGGRILDCLVHNYQCVSVDDRTDNALYGYAFRCISGTGIQDNECRGVLIRGNTVREDRLIPTPEVKREHQLGRFVKKLPERGKLVGQRDWDREETDNWMQGNAVHVAGPEVTDSVRVIGNLVERAGQGFDIHADHIILADNIVDDALIGMKAMHGSKHVIVKGNQFKKTTLWAMGFMPGAASHAARPAEGDRPALPANVDGGSIMANNVITDFGMGLTNWIWGEDDIGFPIRFDRGQLNDNPPLSDVIVAGNIVYDAGRDKILRDGKPEVVGPRYRLAVRVEGGPTAPVGLHFSNNIFHPGTEGVSNVELKP
jgi:hypothetical protein